MRTLGFVHPYKEWLCCSGFLKRLVYPILETPYLYPQRLRAKVSITLKFINECITLGFGDSACPAGGWWIWGTSWVTSHQTRCHLKSGTGWLQRLPGRKAWQRVAMKTSPGSAASSMWCRPGSLWTGQLNYASLQFNWVIWCLDFEAVRSVLNHIFPPVVFF